MDNLNLFDILSGMTGQDVPVAQETEMKELISRLNKASNAYYNGQAIMSDREWDKLFDELVQMEKEAGYSLPDSPTQNVGATVVSKLEKVEHRHPALSLDKTKELSVLSAWLGEHPGMLSWKMDGLTVFLTYEGGILKQAITRGNGYIGEDVTHNAVHFEGVPRKIPYMGTLCVRGEAVMTYSEFERLNSSLSEDDKFKNPRNIASGTVRALNSAVCKERKITFYAFQLAEGSESDSFMGRLDELDSYGFKTVERTLVRVSTLADAVSSFEARIPQLDYPTDGLVLEYDNIPYGLSLGSTERYPRYGMAFKWRDEVVKTTLRKIEWGASRTGLLNPVAVFDPVELEGTTVERASLHNVSYIMDKDLRIGDEIGVYKANMIIPQVEENFTTTAERQRVKCTSDYDIPCVCPVCGQTTSLQGIYGCDDETVTLHCINPDCAAKMVGKLVHFCSRNCMNIEGMSVKKIEALVQKGFLSNYGDFWRLDTFEADIVSMDGFGRKSYENMIAAVKKASKVSFVSLIHALAIPDIGEGQAKLLKQHLDMVIAERGIMEYDLIGTLQRLLEEEYDFSVIEGFGGVIAASLRNWGKANLIPEDKHETGVMDLLWYLDITDVRPAATAQPLKGKTFVITGSLNGYKNRDELVSKIETLGGKVSGSVSAKTSYLINNDVASTTGKNKKAKELGVPIISETEFENLI